MVEEKSPGPAPAQIAEVEESEKEESPVKQEELRSETPKIAMDYDGKAKSKGQDNRAKEIETFKMKKKTSEGKEKQQA